MVLKHDKTNRLRNVTKWQLFVVFLMLCCFLGAKSRNSQDIRCSICKEWIDGQYHQLGSRVACEACYQKYPHCAGCKMPVVSGNYRYQKKRVCPECAERAGVCKGCGDVLLGRRYFHPDLPRTEQYCETCYNSKPRCSLCDLPRRGMTRHDGKYVCDLCALRADRCASCGQPIAGEFYTIDSLPGRFCRKCYEERPHCDTCGKPVASSGRTLSDGRTICARCDAAAIRSSSEAQRLAREVIEILSRELGIHVAHSFDLALVDRRQMAAATGRKKGNEVRSGSRTEMKEMGFFNTRLLPESPRPTILIMSDLPPAAFLETFAHEYAHLWQFERNPELDDAYLCEGFAQWVAAKLLENKGLDAALAKLRKRTDGTYGKGYHRMVQYEESVDGDVAKVLFMISGGKNPRKSTQEDAGTPLGQYLSASRLQGEYGYLRQAVLIIP